MVCATETGKTYSTVDLPKIQPNSAGGPLPSAANCDSSAPTPLLRKVPHTHHYQVTKEGRTILNALLSAHRATVRQFMPTAA